MTTANMTEVRDQLSDFLDIVEGGEELIITRRGRPAAVMLAYDEYEAMVETLNILSDASAMEALAEGEADLAAGRVEQY